MAGSFGWQFILFSAIFYLFLATMLGYGGSKYLDVSVTNTSISGGNYSTNYSSVNVTTADYIGYIWQNPFSSIGYLVWLSVAFLIVDIYIVVTSLIP